MKLKPLINSENEIYDILSGNLWMVLLVLTSITGVFSVLMVTVFPVIPLLDTVIPLTFVLLLIADLVYYYFRKCYKTLAIIVSIYIGLILSPAFIICGHSASNTASLFVVLSFITICFLLDIRKFWLLYGAIAYVNFFVFVKFYLNGSFEKIEHEPYLYFWGFALVFITTAAALVSSAIMQERTFLSIRKKIEENMDKERAAAMAKSRFLANMSNEIRNPMNTIIGLSELSLREDIDEEAKSHVNVLKQSSYDLLEIIDDVLSYSKLETQKIVVRNEEFLFEELIKRILNSISEQTMLKNLKVETVIDHNIPKWLYGDVSIIKQVFLRLIFISILLTENGRIMLSVKCIRDEQEKKAHFICKIKDTGFGLSDADLNAIKGAYTAYDSKQNSNLKGIGLKFNICDELMKLIGGSLQVQSISGVGLESSFEFECEIRDPEPMIRVDGGYGKSVLVYVNDTRELEYWQSIMEGFDLRPDYVNSYFSFEKALQNRKYEYIFILSAVYVSVANIIAAYHCEEETYVVANQNQAYGDFDKCRIIRNPVSCISIARVMNNEWKAEDYSYRNDDIHYDCSKAKILVVDDNSVNLKVAAGIFKLFKIDIDIAKSGFEAIEKATKNGYDIIYMDMVMPEMSGEETLKKMRKANLSNVIKVPVIALTATTGSNVRDEILSLGFQEYLAKPIKKSYLLQTLLTFLPPDYIKVEDNRKKSRKKENKDNLVRKNELSIKDSVLDVKKGIAGLSGNETMYLSVLNTYYRENTEKIELIKHAYETGDIAMFTVYVHAVKSASASIGADVVSVMFKELEAAGKVNNTTYIDNHIYDYLDALRDMIEKTRVYLEAMNAFDK